MENVNIFSEENKTKSNWIKFEEVGEEFQGTLVDKRKTVDAYGKDQMIYEFLTAEGEYRPYGSKSAVDAQMKHVKFGQIVGLKFVESRPSKTVGFQDTKIITVFSNPNLVNKEWLEEQEAEKLENNEQSVEQIAETMPEADMPVPGVNEVAAPVATTPVAAPAAAGATLVADPIAQINALAKTKLLVLKVDLVKDAVQQVTGLALIEMNYVKIIEFLTAMPDKQ